jgi:hypothetical protein
MSVHASMEASLAEVLAEVTMLDAGRVLKQTFTVYGCLGIFVLMSIGIERGASYAMPTLRVPSWLLWLAITWGWVAIATESKSYHRWEFKLYFPTLRWWASFLLAAYIVGAFNLYQVVVAATGHNWAGLLVFYLYALPLLLFIEVINIGHSKLMEKRESETGSAQRRR